jgi:hypothetical protein
LRLLEGPVSKASIELLRERRVARREPDRTMNPLTFAFLGATSMFATHVASGARPARRVLVTTATGADVNGNSFGNASQVSLSIKKTPGSPCVSKGIAGGAYYLQVTDLTGKTLASADSVLNRQVRVVDRQIVGTLGTHVLGLGPCPFDISRAVALDSPWRTCTPTQSEKFSLQSTAPG